MADPKWIELARADLGTQEIRGRKHNRKILEYFADVGHSWVKNDETAWCAAFVGSCLERAGIQSTRKLNAKSYLKWGRPTQNPKLGTVVIFNRGNPNSWQGHVAFYLRETDRYVIVLGGNQSNAVTIESYPKWKVRGYRDPIISGLQTVPKDATEAFTDIDNDPAFDIALEVVLHVEGGYTNHPRDPGGETYKGILLTEYAQYKNVKLTDENRNDLLDQLINISDDELRRIYWRNYWVKVGCNVIPDGLSLFMFDTAVLHGPGVARKTLQEALGVEIDGVIGAKTLRAAEEADAPIVLKRMKKIRLNRLRKSKNWDVFGEGWTNRIETIFDDSLRAAGYVIEDRDRKLFGEDNLTDNAPPPPQPIPAEDNSTPSIVDDKFWLRSMTIWGAIVTIAAVAIPELGKIFGYTVLPEEIQVIGDQGTSIIQSIVSLIGAVMVVYGRLTAATPIRFGIKRKK